MAVSASPRQWFSAITALGIVLLSFGGFIGLAWVSYSGFCSGMAGSACLYPGIDPSFSPALILLGSGLLVPGALFDRGYRDRDPRVYGPGVLFLVLGSAVLEIGLRYTIVSGPTLHAESLILLAASAVMIAQGAESWWRARASISRRSSGPGEVPSVRVSEILPPPRPALRAILRELSVATGVASVALGCFVLVIWQLTLKAACGGLPTYYCTYFGVPPLLGPLAIVLGGVFLLAGALIGGPSHGGSSLSAVARLALLVLAGGVFEVEIALLLWGDGSLGLRLLITLDTLLVAGGFMLARGAGRWRDRWIDPA